MRRLRSSSRRASLPWLNSLLTFVHVPSALAASTPVPDFSVYPTGAQPCLEQAASASGCPMTNPIAANDCLCNDGGGFITKSAQCIAQNDYGDLETTYWYMYALCLQSDTPISVQYDDWVSIGHDAALKATGTGSAGTRTATGTEALFTSFSYSDVYSSIFSLMSTPNVAGGASSQPTKSTTSGSTAGGTTSSQDTGGGGLTTSDIIGLAVGIPSAVAGIAGAAIAWIMYRRKRRRAEESAVGVGNSSSNVAGGAHVTNIYYSK